MKRREKRISQLEQVAWEGYQQFDDASDFIWKTPTLIEHQTEIEKAKLDRYFPNDLKSRRLRWWHESRKLREVFPLLLSTGNVFIALSLSEIYLLRLCLLLESFSGVSLREAKGQGIFRNFDYLHRIGIELSRTELWPQVIAALKIRNCLIHASGFLMHSRDENELRLVLKSGTFLLREHRNSKTMIQIAQTESGDRIQIDNEYPFLLSCYLRDFFAESCNNATKAFPELRAAKLPPSRLDLAPNLQNLS